MSRSITTRLVIAFLIVSVVGAVIAGLLTRWLSQREFNQFVYDQAQNNFIADLSYYYQINGSWEGAAEFLHRRLPGQAPLGQLPAGQPGQPPPQNRLPQQPDDLPRAGKLVFVLVDSHGRVVVPGGGYWLDQTIPDHLLAEGTPIDIDGQVVGTVIATGELPELNARESGFLNRVNWALRTSSLAAAAIALFLGVLLARTLTSPLRQLTEAIRAMARGELGQQVEVRSRDELGELAGAFNQMSADLAHANQMRQQMTADIAHDLRTPLTVIGGYIEAMRDGVLPPSPGRLDALHQEVGHLQRLVADLRTLSLVDSGELRLHRQSCAPAELLERIQTAYEHPAAQGEIELQLQAASDLPTIEIDVERMVQVLGNLVSNALRHTPPGGQVTLSAQKQGNAVFLAVTDNGEGIPAEALPHIFDRFYRGDEARQSDESGLGLAIAKSIVVAHGGELRADSQPGEGARFTIAIPVDG